MRIRHCFHLTLGTRLGPYEIVSPLGAGGMGEVYKLFYIAPGGSPGQRMMAVPVTLGAGFTAASPQMLFQGQLDTSTLVRGYDVTPDGQRFLMVQSMERPPITTTQIVLVQNWFEELRRRVPGAAERTRRGTAIIDFH